MWASSPMMFPQQSIPGGMASWDVSMEQVSSPNPMRNSQAEAEQSARGPMSGQRSQEWDIGVDLWHRRAGASKAPVRLQIIDMSYTGPAVTAIPLSPWNRPTELQLGSGISQGGSWMAHSQQAMMQSQGCLVQAHPWWPSPLPINMHPEYQKFMSTCCYDTAETGQRKRALHVGADDMAAEQGFKRHHLT